MKEVILGIVRHAATFGGGALATKGLADADEVSGAIGAVTTLVGIGWSIFTKLRARKATTPAS